MVKIYAILDTNNIALNFITWDGESEFDFGESQGNQLVLVPENSEYCVGATYQDGEFILPQPEVTPEE
jgi:hypothetical protein